MKKELFIIIFFDDERFEIMAYSLEEAKILAQAERIKHGQSYAVKSWAMANGYNHCRYYGGFAKTVFIKIDVTLNNKNKILEVF